MQIVKTAEAKTIITSHKLVFVDFFTTWCCPCKDFAERVESEVLPMIAPNPNVAFIKVSVEDDDAMKWAESCGMVVVPTTAVFVNGTQVNVTYTNNKGEEVKNAQYIRGNLITIKRLVKDLIAQYV
jgi:thiol-disulfide isomerase/thioredoxin